MQVSWIVSALLAPLFWALTNVFDQVVQRNYAKDELNLSIVVALARLPEALVLFLIFGFYLPDISTMLLSFLHGFILTISVFFYVRALQHEEATRVIIFFQTIPIFVLVLSYFFLGEVLAPHQIGAFFIFLCAGFLSLYRPGVSYGKWSPAVVSLFIFVLFISLQNILLKYVLQFYPSSELMLPWSILGGFLAILPMSFLPFIRKRFRLENFSWFKKSFFVFLLSNIVGIAGFYFFFRAAQTGPIALSSVFTGVQPIFTSLAILVAGKFFKSVPKEDFSGSALVLKGLAFGLSIAGLVLIA